MRARIVLRVAAFSLPLVILAAACTGGGGAVDRGPSAGSDAARAAGGFLGASPSANVLGVTPPAPTGGVVPSHPNHWAGLVARSMVALIRGGHADFIQRVATDAHRASGCEIFPDVAVFPRDLAGKEPVLARKAIVADRAKDGIDGVGHARGHMLPHVTWPGIDHPFLVGVIVAIDCPEE